jgi:two-component system nitrate/nitrite response regulator NarL
MKFLIVDDHAVVREGVAAVLRQAYGDAIVLQAPTSSAALAVAQGALDLDLVLLDLMMPDADGMAALAEFGQLHPGLPIVMVSSSESASDVRRAMALGALGYVPKSANSATLLAAVTLVLSGEVYVPPFMVREGGTATRQRHDLAQPSALTERQREVLKLISLAASNKDIAFQLNLSEKTVKAHVTAIFRALGVVNRAQAARIAQEQPAS